MNHSNIPLSVRVQCIADNARNRQEATDALRLYALLQHLECCFKAPSHQSYA